LGRFFHRTDEIVVLAEGEIEVEIEGKSKQPQIGDEVFIPANAIHTVRNIGKTNTILAENMSRLELRIDFPEIEKSSKVNLIKFHQVIKLINK
jgi:quercetin dioxygenase-like cupin family protein|tara:strand:- start:82 stop:360 length:279 start_codon:yes stop_codon:yes gene_type:complete